MRAMFSYLVAALVAGTTQAGAVALEACDRTTHVFHGGEAAHADLGEGRVIWKDWWSQEGTALDLVIAECGSGETLQFRAAEDNMNARLPFDKADAALEIIATEHRAARVFVTLPRLAEAVEKFARDIEITTVAQESCACAALYPDLRADKTPFLLPDDKTSP